RARPVVDDGPARPARLERRPAAPVLRRAPAGRAARLRGAGRPGRRGLGGALAASPHRGLAGTARPGAPLGAGAPGAVDRPPHSRCLQWRWAAPEATAVGAG